MREFNTKPDRGVFVSSIIAVIGAIFLILGLIVPYSITPNLEYTEIFIVNRISISGEYYYSLRPQILVIVIVAILIMVIGIITAKNNSSEHKHKSNLFSKPNLLFFLLFVMFIFPTMLSMYGYYYFFLTTFSPMIAVLLSMLTETGDMISEYSMRDPIEANYRLYGPGYFLVLIGIILLVVAFFMITYQTVGTWRKKSLIRSKADDMRKSRKSFEKIILIVTAICSFGVILGVAAPTYMWLDRNPPNDMKYDSLMIYLNEHDGNYRGFLNAGAFLYFLFYVGLFISIILYLSKDKVRSKLPINKLSLVFFLVICTMLPYPNPMQLTLNWVPSLGMILLFFEDLMYYYGRDWIYYREGLSDTAQVMSPIGWYFVISVCILIVIVFLFLGMTLLERLQNKNREVNQF